MLFTYGISKDAEVLNDKKPRILFKKLVLCKVS